MRFTKSCSSHFIVSYKALAVHWSSIMNCLFFKMFNIITPGVFVFLRWFIIPGQFYIYIKFREPRTGGGGVGQEFDTLPPRVVLNRRPDRNIFQTFTRDTILTFVNGRLGCLPNGRCWTRGGSKKSLFMLTSLMVHP